MNEQDETRLRDMLDAAREVVAFTEGEAAAQVSHEFQATTPQIPWPQIVGMRNRLIHGYRAVNLERLWRTATEDIPSLIPELERLLPPER